MTELLGKRVIVHRRVPGGDATNREYVRRDDPGTVVAVERDDTRWVFLVRLDDGHLTSAPHPFVTIPEVKS